MKFKTVQHGPVSVIELEGNLMGGPDATTLNSKLHELIEAGKKNVVVDLGGVQFMNSSGLGQLIAGVRAMKSAGGDLKIANTSAKISALIKITKLTSIFETYDSVQKALESFKE
ncbi:MAG: STAS domain-containing protein [Ignavibacteria bacterium]|nr:STAS domain-containing protein [Ignavibacteria bacterium]